MPVGKARREGAAPAATDKVEAPPEVSPETAAAAESDTVPEADETAGRVVFVERKPPGARAPIVIAVAAALFVGAGAFAGATLAPYVADRAQVDTKLTIARTAADAITTLWTLSLIHI